MHKKSESLNWLKIYKANAETHTNSVLQKFAVHEFRGPISEPGDIVKLKAPRCDNGADYLSNEFKA